jgi:hypothetical protein
MAEKENDGLVLDVLWVDKKAKVTARFNGEVVYIHTFDPAKANQRKQFTQAVKKKLPQVDEAVIEADLLRIADTVGTPTLAPHGVPVELDISRIVRPELFIAREVCGLTVPVVIDVDGKPAARWMQYLRWADGRRECRNLSSCISLPDGTTLWVNPMPGEPSMSTAAGWSAPARRAWLKGSAAPNPAELFKRLCEQLAYFLDLPSTVAAGTTAMLALWVMLTYIFQAWGSVPYLFVGGPTNSGKTRLFEILSRLVRRVLSSSNLTAPALFRTLNDRGGTLLFDEAERLKQPTPDVQEVLSMLLAGYKRGGQATRLEAVGDSFRTVSFDVFGPKALACITGLPSALASRCITIMMFRAGPPTL